jgi:predicted ATPase
MIKILAGSHGVGKTTQLQKIKTHFEKSKKVIFIEEINTALANLGLAIDGKGKDFDFVMQTQLIALNLGIEVLSLLKERKENVYMDRCFLDTFVYTMYFFFKQKENSESSSLIFNIIKNIIEEKVYLLKKGVNIYILEPSKDFFDSKGRMDRDSQLAIHGIYLETLKKMGIPHTIIKTNNENFNNISNFIICDK